MERFLAESLHIGTKTVHATFQIFNGVDYHTLSKNLGTSIGMLEKHYSHLTPTLGANKLAGKRFPDLVK